MDFFNRGINALDELGYSGGLPGSDIAPEVQLMAEAKAARRNLALARQGLSQGMNALQAGQETLSSYRPGGAAALTSGLFQSQADLAFRGALAQQQEAPDLMFRYDERKQKSAEAKAKSAALTSGLISLAGTAIGAGLTAATGGAAAPVALGLSFGGQGNPNQYPQPIGPPGSDSVSNPGQPPQIGPPTAQQAAQGGGGQAAGWNNVDFQGMYNAVQRGVSGGGGGGGIQSTGGPTPGGPSPGPGAGAPQGAPGGGGGKPQAGPSGAPGGPTAGAPMRWNGVSMRGGDLSGAVGPAQIGRSQDLQLPADVMNAIFEQRRTEPSTADIFDAMFWQLVSGSAA